MCNQWCLEFASDSLPLLQKSARVLEVGSRNVNGSVREVLSGLAGEYIGVDLFDGPGVDVVCNVTALTDTFASQSFDLVVSTEMLEHCLNWQDALYQMASVLRQGGLLLITTRSPGFELHDYPADHWRFSYGDFERIFQPLGEIVALQNDMTLGWPCGIGILVKRKLDQSQLSEWKSWLDAFAVYSMTAETALPKTVGDLNPEGMIFDQYSRYKACSDLLRQTDFVTGNTVLDIGSGPECLFGQFMPDATMTYVDPLIPSGSGQGHITGNIFASELDGQTFDCISAVDVLEHVPSEHRQAFLQRMSSLGKNTLILGFPTSDSSDALETDKAIDDQYRAIYGQDYSWLEEHYRYGLPSLAGTVEQLNQLGWHCQTVGHGHAAWLRELLSFVLCVWEKPAYRNLVLSLSERFNKELVGHDFTGPFYRQFVIATRAPIAPFVPPKISSEFEEASAIFRQLMDDAWSEYFRLSLNEITLRDTEIAQLNRQVEEVSGWAQGMQLMLAERDAENSMLKQLAASRESQLQLFHQSLSWRITSPLRFMLRTYRRRGLEPSDSQYLRKILNRVLGFARPRQVKASRPCLASVAHSPTVGLPPQAAGMEDVFVWAVIDWHFRLQRPQHLARELAMLGRRVFYFSNNFVNAAHPGFEVEGLGAEGRLFQVRLHVEGAPAIYWTPPSHEALAQLRKSMATFLEWAGSNGVVNIVQHSFWHELACSLPNSRLVYDCMDHHEGFGNVSQEMLSLERALAENADLLVVTSQWLDDALKAVNPHRQIIRNACQYEHFAEAPVKRYQDTVGRKIIGYYGAIAEWFDLALVKEVANAFPDYLVLLVGADTCDAKTALSDCANVAFTGEVPYSDLPFYLYAFDVCLLPFHVVPLTLATNPVKLYEYLSAGKSVVAVELPEMRQFGELIQVAANHTDFLKKVREALTPPPTIEEINRRKAFAAEQTWAHRARQLAQAIDACPEPMVSVIVLTYNNLEMTKACLHSLETLSDYPALEIIVVDNASSDGSPEYLRDWVDKLPGRRLILNEDNKGFAAGNNQGLAVATGDYLVLLNNDTYVTPGWVRTMTSHLRRDPSIGLLGPVTNNIGNEARINIHYSDMAEMHETASRYARQHIGQTFPMRTAAFFCVIIPRGVYERVGPLDEAFGRGFFEDDDYCRRVEQLGLRVVCAEDVFIHHHLSASFNKLKDQERQALFERNKAVYEAKWGKWVPHTYRSNGEC
jgi:GT2 family glycosyltransferase